MAPVTIFLLCTYMCLSAASGFITLDCPQENHGVYGKKSMLVCVVRVTLITGDEATIKAVIWEKNEERLLTFSGGKYINKTNDDFQFAEPAWYVKNMNVSLMLKNTKLTDNGVYTCLVVTDMGITEKVTTSLRVTAEYKTPTMNSTPGENIKEDTDVTMFCNTTGGDQVGSIRWYDKYGSDFTRSAQLESHKTEDGLFNLSSKFTVRGATSTTSSEYRCSVHNARGVQEGEATLQLQFISGQTNPGDSSITIRYVAPLVVIGSVVAGLLLAVLVCRRRSHRHQPLVMNDPELQPEIVKSPQDGQTAECVTEMTSCEGRSSNLDVSGDCDRI